MNKQVSFILRPYNNNFNQVLIFDHLWILLAPFNFIFHSFPINTTFYNTKISNFNSHCSLVAIATATLVIATSEVCGSNPLGSIVQSFLSYIFLF